MPKRGQVDEKTGLLFWRISRGREHWITNEDYDRRRSLERKRISRFLSKNPNYTPPSHKKENARARAAEYRKNNPEKTKKANRIWAEKNRSHLRFTSRNRYHNNPTFRGKILANSAIRRSLCSRISPNESFCVKFLYGLAKAFSCGGEKHVVDHVLPIKPQGGAYCGLTNTSNLRIIPYRQNAVKKNKDPLGCQMQNAQIGKIGTAPAQMGEMQTQGLNA